MKTLDHVVYVRKQLDFEDVDNEEVRFSMDVSSVLDQGFCELPLMIASRHYKLLQTFSRIFA